MTYSNEFEAILFAAEEAELQGYYYDNLQAEEELDFNQD